MSARDSIREVVSENARALKKHRGWTQEQIAAKSGISQTHVGNVLRGTVEPTTSILEGLGRAFGIPAWLLLVPNLPIEILDSRQIPDLLSEYLKAASKPLPTLIAERAAGRGT